MVILLPLLISLLLSLLAQWRYKYQSLPSPKVVYEHVSNQYDKFLLKSSQLDHENDTLENLFIPKRGNNHKRAKLIIFSMILFLISMGIMVTGIVISFSIAIK